MEYNAYRIENEKTLLPSLLKMSSMLQISFWYNMVHDDQNKVERIYIRRSNCEKETGLSTKNKNTNYK